MKLQNVIGNTDFNDKKRFFNLLNNIYGGKIEKSNIYKFPSSYYLYENPFNDVFALYLENENFLISTKIKSKFEKNQLLDCIVKINEDYFNQDYFKALLTKKKLPRSTKIYLNYYIRSNLNKLSLSKILGGNIAIADLEYQIK